MNNILFIILFLATVTFLQGVEIFLFERKNKQGKIYLRWSAALFSAIYVLLVISAVAEYFFLGIKINTSLSIAGIILLLVRFLIKYWSVKSLGEFWSSHVQIKDNHKIITSGPYRYIRHPVYFARIINVIAVPLITNSFWTLAVFLPINVFLVLTRIKIEEKLLSETFGEEYLIYRKHTNLLVPLIY